MLRFILVRLAAALPTLLGMSFVAFAIVALAPGDPVMMELRAMGIVPKPEDIAAIQAEYGLDKPFFARYFDWLGRAVRFEFGTSVATGRTVMAEIMIHLPATLALAISALLGAIVISLTLGSLAAMAGQFAGAGLRGVTVLLVSVPSFWLALLLIYIFVLRLGWARLVGDGSLSDLILPAVTLSLAVGAALGRMVYERIRSEIERRLCPTCHRQRPWPDADPDRPYCTAHRRDLWRRHGPTRLAGFWGERSSSKAFSAGPDWGNSYSRPLPNGISR